MKKFLYEGFFINILFHMEPNIGSLNPYSLATSFFSSVALSIVSALGRWILPPFCLPSLRSRVFSSFALSSPCPLLDQCLSSLWITVWPPCEAGSVFCWDQGSFGRWICFPSEASSVLARDAWKVFPLEECHYLLRKLCLALISKKMSVGQNQFSL